MTSFGVLSVWIIVDFGKCFVLFSPRCSMKFWDNVDELLLRIPHCRKIGWFSYLGVWQSKGLDLNIGCYGCCHIFPADPPQPKLNSCDWLRPRVFCVFKDFQAIPLYLVQARLWSVLLFIFFFCFLFL